jgi:AcrR family transcriptional regulator
MPDTRPSTARRRPTHAIATLPRKERKGTQRPRLLAAMIALAAEHGYAEVTIAEVIARAGVSRPTFYEYFSDKDACFLAALDSVADDLQLQVADAVKGAPSELAENAVLAANAEYTTHHPAEARLLFCESLAGGPRALDIRDRSIAETTVALEDARALREPNSLAPDIPPWLTVATIQWSLARHLRRHPLARKETEQQLAKWLASYARPSSEHRWLTLEAGPPQPESPFQSALPAEAPGVLPPGRPRLSRGEVARNQRERILHATGKVASEHGYAAASITEIAAAAGLDARVFYTHFPDKQQAFLAAHELGFEHTMAVSAGAFFSVAEWPERVRQGILAGTQFQASHPMLTHMLYVQSYAIGPAGIQRIEDTHAAFTVFLQEGNRLASEPQPPAVLDAIIAANFEIAFHLSRQDRGEDISRFAPLMTYLCLAPFLGAQAASEFVT